LYERYHSRLQKILSPSKNKSPAPVPLETQKLELDKKPANTK